MEFRLLGEMELRAAGRLLDLGVPRQQIVLTALAVDAGRPVSVETLIDRVWDDSPPAAARNVLYSHLSRIRRVLREASVLSGAVCARIDRRHAGYVLDVDPDLVDVHRFRRLVDQGCDPRGSDSSRAEVLNAALALWRGPPMAGLSGKWIARIRDSWQRQRLDAVMHWAEVQLRLDRPDGVISLLPDLVGEYPLVEPLEGLLMRALRMAGRDAEALHRYAAVRQRLVVELGADPGSELRRLHQAILHGESLPSSVPPAQLPLDVPGFTGREQELRSFNDLLASTAVAVAVVSGSAGVGKTTLAVHWAHQVRDRFPAGQLYIDLCGYAHGPPLRPEQVLSQFLRALGVRPEHVPTGLAEAAALYRSVLADKRVLVLLDNANSADHVRPLLPANPDCLVVITSRNRLDGLVAVDGARRVALDVLPLQDAVALLATILGQGRVTAESEAAAEFARICARLPLALRIAASHLAGYPDRRIAEHVTALRHSDLLAALQVDGDEQAAVHAAFGLSYSALKPDTQSLFRLLGLAPGPDIGLAAVAALIDQPQERAERLLAQLHATHLIEERSHGRFAFHDLLRRYAKERGKDEDSEQERDAAFDRLIRFYLQTTNAAAEHLYPQLLRLTTLPDPAPGVFAGSPEALAWLDGERPNLVAAVQMAHKLGRAELAWLLADALRGYFNLRRHMSCWFAVAHTAVAAAEHHPMPQAAAHMSLGRAYQCLAHYPEAPLCQTGVRHRIS
jgi:DNA-binding SARP family transcriptional activator